MTAPPVSIEAMLNRLATASIELAIAGAAVLLFLRLFRAGSPRVASLLWTATLVKPLVSLLAGSVFAMDWSFLAGGVHAPFVLREVSLTEVTGATGLAAARDGISVSAGFVVLSVWFVGAGWFCSSSIVDRLRIRRLVSRSSPPGAALAAVFRDVAPRNAWRKLPRLLVSPDLESPALVGSLRPAILLPEWMERMGRREQLRWVLRHELSHWRSFDPLAALAGETTRNLFFFHPVAWWARRRWKLTTEAACDRSLVVDGTDARRYAHELYRILFCVRDRRRPLLNAGLFATRTEIGRRIEWLLASRASRRWTGVLAGGIAIVLAGAVFALGAGEVGGGDPATAERASHNVTVNVRGEVHFNREKTGVVSMGPGAWVGVVDESNETARILKITPGADGAPEYDYRVDGTPRGFDDEARAWLAGVMRRLATGPRKKPGELI